MDDNSSTAATIGSIGPVSTLADAETASVAESMPPAPADGAEAVAASDFAATAPSPVTVDGPLEPDAPLAPSEPSDTATIRYEALYIFGINNLSTRDIKELFSWTPDRIEWINDASCLVVWTDFEPPREVIDTLAQLTPEAEAKLKQIEERLRAEEAPELDTLLLEYKAVAWRKLPLAGEWIERAKCDELTCRYGTVEDRKQRNAYTNSKYYKTYGRPKKMESRLAFNPPQFAGVKKRRDEAPRALTTRRNDDATLLPVVDAPHKGRGSTKFNQRASTLESRIEWDEQEPEAPPMEVTVEISEGQNDGADTVVLPRPRSVFDRIG
eukprot:m.106543 g.106543  ORF g.106543 m.106543 type:complete len:325 (+) comp9183_c0_seq6:176-1150(+)